MIAPVAGSLGRPAGAGDGLGKAAPGSLGRPGGGAGHSTLPGR